MSYLINPYKVTPDDSYESGLGSAGNWLVADNLSTNDDVATPSGLSTAGLTKSWLSDGSSTIISTDSGQIFPVDSDLSCVVWIYSTNVTSETQCILNSVSNNYFVLYLAGGADNFEFKVNDGTDSSGGEKAYPFAANTWYMVAGTFEASTGKTVSYVYSGGALKTVATSDCNTVATNTDWKMMGASGTPNETFIGRILSPAIWNVVLSESDLDDLYDSGAGVEMNTIQKDKIVCYWDSQTGTAPILNLAIP
jgi:hypothetical protein